MHDSERRREKETEHKEREGYNTKQNDMVLNKITFNRLA